MEKIDFLEGQISRMLEILGSPFKSSSSRDFLKIKADAGLFITYSAICSLFTGYGGLSREQSSYYRNKLNNLSDNWIEWASSPQY